MRLIYWYVRHSTSSTLHVRSLDARGYVVGGMALDSDEDEQQRRQRRTIAAWECATGVTAEELPGNPGGLKQAPELSVNFAGKERGEQ